MEDYVDINMTSRLHRDGRMENTRSGNGVVAGTYRKPVSRGKYFYYRLAEGKNLNIQSAMKKHFDVDLVTDDEWFKAEIRFITDFNFELIRQNRKDARRKEKQNKLKRKAISDLLDGSITKDEAESILGTETVEVILSGESAGGVMTRRISYHPFNEFGTIDAGELPPEAWGFDNGKRAQQ